MRDVFNLIVIFLVILSSVQAWITKEKDIFYITHRDAPINRKTN